MTASELTSCRTANYAGLQEHIIGIVRPDVIDIPIATGACLSSLLKVSRASGWLFPFHLSPNCFFSHFVWLRQHQQQWCLFDLWPANVCMASSPNLLSQRRSWRCIRVLQIWQWRHGTRPCSSVRFLMRTWKAPGLKMARRWSQMSGLKSLILAGKLSLKSFGGLGCGNKVDWYLNPDSMVIFPVSGM